MTSLTGPYQIERLANCKARGSTWTYVCAVVWATRKIKLSRELGCSPLDCDQEARRWFKHTTRHWGLIELSGSQAQRGERWQPRAGNDFGVCFALLEERARGDGGGEEHRGSDGREVHLGECWSSARAGVVQRKSEVCGDTRK
jgi:hypothetical protein